MTPKLIEVFHLKFHEGLTDRAIAQRMGVCARTLCNYWRQIADFWRIYYDSVEKIYYFKLRSMLVK